MPESEDQRQRLAYLPAQPAPISVPRLVISTLIGAVVGVTFALFAAFVTASLLAMLGVSIRSGIAYGGVLLCFALVVGLITFRQIRMKKHPSVYNSVSTSRNYLLGTVLGSGTTFLTLATIHLWINLHR